MKKDFIIIGQGLAGTILGLSLIKRGYKVLIVDDSHASSSSMVAAGLFNPVVFKRLVLSWKADELLPFAERFYKNLEAQWNDQFYFNQKILKVFVSEDEKTLWNKKRNDPETGAYLEKIIEDKIPATINAPLGLAKVNKAGNIDVKRFLELSLNFFKKKESFVNGKVNDKEVEINEGNISWRDFTAQKMIFCTGSECIKSDFFSWLPFVLTKGETLTISIKDFSIEEVVNKGVFILPLGNDLYKVGATYNWKHLDNIPSSEGRHELEEKLNKILKTPYEIIKHQAGVRPTVKDRRPLIGLHPAHNSIGIFNGLGTKGVMLAPFLANHFINFLEQKTALNKEVNIQRFTTKESF